MPDPTPLDEIERLLDDPEGGMMTAQSPLRPIHWVDMTPDDGLVLRILRSYLDYSVWSDGHTPSQNPAVVQINADREARNALIEQAVQALCAVPVPEQEVEE